SFSRESNHRFTAARISSLHQPARIVTVCKFFEWNRARGCQIDQLEDRLIRITSITQGSDFSEPFFHDVARPIQRPSRELVKKRATQIHFFQNKDSLRLAGPDVRISTVLKSVSEDTGHIRIENPQDNSFETWIYLWTDAHRETRRFVGLPQIIESALLGTIREKRNVRSPDDRPSLGERTLSPIIDFVSSE